MHRRSVLQYKVRNSEASPLYKLPFRASSRVLIQTSPGPGGTHPTKCYPLDAPYLKTVFLLRRDIGPGARARTHTSQSARCPTHPSFADFQTVASREQCRFVTLPGAGYCVLVKVIPSILSDCLHLMKLRWLSALAERFLELTAYHI